MSASIDKFRVGHSRDRRHRNCSQSAKRPPFPPRLDDRCTSAVRVGDQRGTCVPPRTRPSYSAATSPASSRQPSPLSGRGLLTRPLQPALAELSKCAEFVVLKAGNPSTEAAQAAAPNQGRRVSSRPPSRTGSPRRIKPLQVGLVLQATTGRGEEASLMKVPFFFKCKYLSANC